MWRCLGLMLGMVVVFFFWTLPDASFAGEIRFAVFSDPHVYDTRLGDTGSAFEAYLSKDRKMIRESESILKSTVNQILKEEVDFVLVPGDLTKDGEMASHLMFQNCIQLLEDNGISVFPTAGNHDIYNPHAVSYDGDDTTPVKKVSPLEFRRIHWEHVYRHAVFADSGSLSYVVEPVDGLWLMAIDSCKYDKYADHPETSGAISKRTLTWISRVMEEAEQSGKTVFAFLHHGVLQHYKTQSILFGDYVIDNWRRVAKRLSAMGVKVVFTGHYHAQDIVKYTWQDIDESALASADFLFDIETGSLVTAPVPFRVLTYDDTNQMLAVESHTIKEIDYDTGGVPFPEYAHDFLYEGLLMLSEEMLISMFGLSEQDAQCLAPYASSAYVAHYAGDEQIDPDSEAMIAILLDHEDPVMKLLGLELSFLWTDPAPCDNAILIDLNTGAVSR